MPFTDEVLENIGGQEGCHQIKIVSEDRRNITSATKWGLFQYMVMPFGLKNSPAIFSRVVVTAFKEIIHKFFEVYFDDWTVFELFKKHVSSLCLMLDMCRKYHISLNLKKCIFYVPYGILLEHVICKKGLMVDPTNIVVVINFDPPKNVKQLRTTLGHTGQWRSY